MNLIRHNAITTPTSRQIGAVTINFNARNGTASLTNATVDILEIVDSDRLELIQDADRLQDWYIAKTESGFPLRNNRDQRGSSQFSCKGVIRAILKSLNLPLTSTIRLNIDPTPIVQDGITMFALATKSAQPRP